jgi:hypothetical protein
LLLAFCFGAFGFWLFDGEGFLAFGFGLLVFGMKGGLWKGKGILKGKKLLKGKNY